MALHSILSYLTKAGIGSRRHCFHLLTTGRVSVNDQVVLSSTTPIRQGIDVIAIDGRVLESVVHRVYLKLNKPPGVLSTTYDDRNRPTIMDYIPKRFRDIRLFPVGRLDAHSTGLILLTNDGEFANRVTHPRFRVEKEYHVEFNNKLTPSQCKALEEGVIINGERTAPSKVRLLSEGDSFGYSITINEGKKRQIRMMCLAVGQVVRSLERVRIQSILLGGLLPGRVQEVSIKEVHMMFHEYEHIEEQVK